MSKREMVDHPEHYNQGKIEVIDAIEDWSLNFCEGNVIKYVARHRFKDEPIEDRAHHSNRSAGGNRLFTGGGVGCGELVTMGSN